MRTLILHSSTDLILVRFIANSSIGHRNLLTRIVPSMKHTMPTNTAAWLTGAKASPLEIKSAPYTPPHEDEIVVKNGAVAINPVDWMIQDQGTSIMFTWLKYPFVLGTDVAGEVFEIGSRVTHFKIGDRVIGHAVGHDQKHNRAAEGAFQTYTVLLAHMASPIPSNLSYESASVLPLGVSTAACGLFQKDQLALQYPRRFQSQQAKLCLSGKARQASAVMRSSSRSQPDMKSLPQPRPRISATLRGLVLPRCLITIARLWLPT